MWENKIKISFLLSLCVMLSCNRYNNIEVIHYFVAEKSSCQYQYKNEFGILEKHVVYDKGFSGRIEIKVHNTLYSEKELFNDTHVIEYEEKFVYEKGKNTIYKINDGEKTIVLTDGAWKKKGKLYEFENKTMRNNTPNVSEVCHIKKKERMKVMGRMRACIIIHCETNERLLYDRIFCKGIGYAGLRVDKKWLEVIISFRCKENL